MAEVCVVGVAPLAGLAVVVVAVGVGGPRAGVAGGWRLALRRVGQVIVAGRRSRGHLLRRQSPPYLGRGSPPPPPPRRRSQCADRRSPPRQRPLPGPSRLRAGSSRAEVEELPRGSVGRVRRLRDEVPAAQADSVLLVGGLEAAGLGVARRMMGCGWIGRLPERSVNVVKAP